MKVIDLLNKIANGEEVPKKIKFNGFIWTYDIYNKRYCEGENLLFNVLGHYKGIILNDEVEIVKEEKKIPEKLDHLIGYDIQQFDDLREYVEITTNDLFGKENKIIDILNEIIDYLESRGE